MNLKATINVDRLDRDRIEAREYTGQDGKQVNVRELKIDVIPLKEAKTITEGDTWVLKKTHFITQSPTKQEREDRVQMDIIGDAVQFVDKQVEISEEDKEILQQAREAQEQKATDMDSINPDDIPFN